MLVEIIHVRNGEIEDFFDFVDVSQVSQQIFVVTVPCFFFG